MPDQQPPSPQPAGSGPPSSWAPFAGMRVLDCSTEIAGGYCSKLLVDAGADVLLAEGPAGDPLRRWVASGTPIGDEEDGALFRFLRAGTQSLDVDADRLHVLAAQADVLLESANLAGFSTTVDRLRAANPRLVVVSLTPWGATGPWADRPATEFIVQAASGGTGRRGLPEREPITAGGRLAEWLLGTFAAVGAVTAWRHARQTGHGQHVDVSMLEACNLCLNGPYQLIAKAWRPELIVPRTVEVPSIEPAADGSVGFSTQTAQQWADFCVLIGHPELAEEPLLRRADERTKAIERLRPIIGGYTSVTPAAEITALATALRIPVAPVGNGEVLPMLDHFVDRGVYQVGAHGTVQPRIPYQVQGYAPLPWRPAPRLHEHAHEHSHARWAERPEAPPSAPSKELPLQGLRVADLTAFWAGPFATTYLAALGADVVKVESIQRTDGIRFLGGLDRDRVWEWSMVYHGANPGKRDVTLDLNREEGVALLRQLIARSDVLIENYSARVMEQFGLPWEEVQAINPRCIMVRMPAYGLTGPWRDRVGFAMTIEQVSGLAWVTGYDDMPLVPRGPCDPVGGMHAVLALLGALETREESGTGTLVEVALVEAALNIAAEQVLEWSAYGALVTRTGNRSAQAAPQGIYRGAADNDHLALAVRTDDEWRTFAALLGLAEDPGLDRAADRHARHDDLDLAIRSWIEARPAELRPAQVLAAELRAAGIPATRVTLSHEALPNEQLEHREFIQWFDHPVTGPTPYPRFPIRFSAFAPLHYRGPAPTLGQHNDEVLGELGVPAQRLAELRALGVIGEAPLGVQP